MLSLCKRLGAKVSASTRSRRRGSSKHPEAGLILVETALGTASGPILGFFCEIGRYVASCSVT